MNTPINLFCLPFAGGSKYSYNNFESRFPPGIKIQALDFPGRGSRVREELVYSMNELTQDVYRQLKPMLHHPYALFGHSMGGILCYLLSVKIRQQGDPAPVHLFVTGTSGPSWDEPEPMYYQLEKKEFIKALRELGGIPLELLENSELFDFFEPVLRADLEAIDTYKYNPAPPLDIPITAIRGADESVTRQSVMTWQNESTKPLDLLELPGNHFFVFDHIDTIGEIIKGKLQPCVV
jgi:surfactin synthase thioesterase subunit